MAGRQRVESHRGRRRLSLWTSRGTRPSDGGRGGNGEQRYYDEVDLPIQCRGKRPLLRQRVEVRPEEDRSVPDRRRRLSAAGGPGPGRDRNGANVPRGDRL